MVLVLEFRGFDLIELLLQSRHDAGNTIPAIGNCRRDESEP
jgi:hypothetical protein